MEEILVKVMNKTYFSEVKFTHIHVSVCVLMCACVCIYSVSMNVWTRVLCTYISIRQKINEVNFLISLF